MKNAATALLAVFFLGLPVPVQAEGRGPVRLAVRIFRIPAEQSFRVERPDGRGGKLSLQASGNISARFPHGTVIITTELARNASDSTIGRAISERVAFGCGDLVADNIKANELRSFDFSLDAEHPAEAARFEESLGEGRTADYELRVESLSGGPGEPLIRLRFYAGWSAQAGSLGVGMSEDVISTVAEVPESRLLLIGAPGDKAVYFLAVCALPR